MSNPLDWYERGREVLRSWAATSPTAAEAARMAPLGRALDCVDAGDRLVALADAYFDALDGGTESAAVAWVESIAKIKAARAAYHAVRSSR